MIKNPFAKNDVGCSFMCFFTLFLAIQFLFLWFFIKVAYINNNQDIIINIAQEQGYKYFKANQSFYPQVTQSDFLQTSGFIYNQNLWLCPILFYFFSIMWVVSYFRLLFTDIQNKDYVEDPSQFTQIEYCRKCNTKRRKDTYHCSLCNVCSEYHDHHCGVVQVCICGKNYKYFILFIAYTGLMCLAFLGSLVGLSQCVLN